MEDEKGYSHIFTKLAALALDLWDTSIRNFRGLWDSLPPGQERKKERPIIIFRVTVLLRNVFVSFPFKKQQKETRKVASVGLSFSKVHNLLELSLPGCGCCWVGKPDKQALTHTIEMVMKLDMNQDVCQKSLICCFGSVQVCPSRKIWTFPNEWVFGDATNVLVCWALHSLPPAPFLLPCAPLLFSTTASSATAAAI